MRFATLAIIALLAFPVSAQSQASDAHEIIVSWSGSETPSRVWIQSDADAIELTLQGNRYVGRPTLGLTIAKTAILNARYSDTVATLPVRLRPGKKRVAFLVHRSDTPLACVARDLDRIEGGTTYITRLTNYFDAQRMMRQWPPGCAPGPQARIINARYRHAYNLAIPRDSDIARDADAAEAWNRVRPRDRVHVRYNLVPFDAEQLELAGLEGRADYNHQLSLVRAGDYSEALAVNEALTEAMTADETLLRSMTVTQGVTLNRLALDRALIETRATPVE